MDSIRFEHKPAHVIDIGGELAFTNKTQVVAHSLKIGLNIVFGSHNL